MRRNRWRWYEFAPEALLAVGLGTFVITEPRAALSGLESPRAIALMVVVAVLWVAVRLLLVRFVRWRAVGIVVFTIAALGVLRVVVYPSYDNRTVVETFPLQAAAEVGPSSIAPTPTTSPTPTTAPVVVRTAMFAGIDHRASGTVTTYRTGEGRYVVGLENIDIQPGPDYDVYVAPGAGREDKDGATRLDDLRGNKGTQYYDVPAEVMLEGDWTVLVWCEVFDVPIANA